MGELRERLDEVGISGYPESHHFISDETTIEAMFEKEPMATYIVSQICFDADVIATWIRRVRDRGTLLPIWIGVPGAVDNRKLLRTSLRIGLGESVRFLRSQRGWLRRFILPRLYTPTKLLRALVPSFADPAARVGGIHVYTFNELERTERWRLELIEQLTRQEV
jgi:methylenetetrahydrofolate reductase (NADPH)